MDAVGGVAPAKSPPAAPDAASHDAFGTVASLRRLADIFHLVLSEQDLDRLLERIADALQDLVPYDALTIYEADPTERELVAVLTRDPYGDAILGARGPRFGEGITGWAVENRRPVLANEAHLDPRVVIVPGTPRDPEALITVPLIARDAIKGALNIYRDGPGRRFSHDDLELATRFGDAAALALDNAQSRMALERLAQTDSLTGLYNHRFFHERLRAELVRASRAGDTVSVLMLDIDDFKRINDIYGHAIGDQILVTLSDMLRATVRASDVVCRLGGEELAVIMPSCDLAAARGFAARLAGELRATDVSGVGSITASMGIAVGPEQAANARELAWCAEAAMMTAKSQGKDRVVVYGSGGTERPLDRGSSARDMRSIAHLKMLQSLAGKLNRLNDVRAIAMTIATELRTLIDYHDCRVYIADGQDLLPVALVSAGEEESYDALKTKFGEGITGRAAQLNESLLISNALECDFAVDIPGTEEVPESIVAVPLSYGSRVIGVIVLSSIGVDQFDEADVRLMEVLAGNASVALENAHLYEAQRREAERANALLAFGRDLAGAETLSEVLELVARRTAHTLRSPKTSVWLEDVGTGELVAEATWGYEGDAEHDVAGVRVPLEALRGVVSAAEPTILRPETLDELIPSFRGAEGRVNDHAYAIVPLVLDGGRVGAIAAAAPDEEGYAFLRAEMTLLTGIAHQAKLAIGRAWTLENLENTFLATVESLVNALEAKDPYASSHARAITNMAIEVGREMGLGPRALKRTQLGALFHNIGKIGIPSSILHKPGPLSPAERAVLDTHKHLGDRILAPLAGLGYVRPPVSARAGGGTGKSAGSDEPIESRIVVVCDAYHAMTADRPYRAALTAAEARAELEAGAGERFDPEVVAVFLRLLDERPGFAGDLTQS
jgi:diguanylate cyclase (GGDEF)-like protein